MDEDEYRIKSVELQTRQVVLTEEQNKKLDTLATKECVENDGALTLAAISVAAPKANGDAKFYRTLITWLVVALFVALGLTAAIDFIAAGGG